MLELSFESGDDSLSVRRFSVREAVSTLFEVEIEACSPSEDLDLESLVGKAAVLRVGAAGRLFRGVCSAVEQVRAEPSGLSTYALRIVPALWLLTQRRNYRLFQHLSVPGVVRAVLAEWSIESTFQVDEARHPQLEVRVQYGETDFDFVSRLLEDAGIAFVFPQGEKDPPLLLTDNLFATKSQAAPRIPYVGDASAARERDHVTDVRLAQEVRPGRFTIRDSDFRRSPDYPLVGTAASGSSDDRFEHYHYRPGSFLVEPAADAAARHDEKEGRAQAERGLGSLRASKRAVSFQTSVALWPGAIFSMVGHPRADLAPGRDLLVTELVTAGTAADVPTRSGRAAFVGSGGSGDAWLPPQRAPRPRVHGVQSAVVVGPKGQEIHTDELGRVRVQFPWDREGRFDERSFGWVRVSQGWAGGAFGMMALPSVGQEVLVEFVEGDPDQPVVVGRVYNSQGHVPYKLPEHRTVSAWKSSSSPGGEGSNEILFEDAKGGERLFVQAERDLERLVKRDESTTVGNDRSQRVAGDETLAVGGERRATIGDSDVVTVGARHAVSIASAAGAAGASTGSEIVDGRISFTTGQATLTLDGPQITLDAAAGILLKAATDIALMAEGHITARADVSLTLGAGATLVVRSEGGDVVIQGGPNVHINPEIVDRTALAAAGADPPPAVPPGVDLDEQIALAEEHARFDPAAPSWFNDKLAPGGAWDYARLGAQYAPFASFHYGVMGRAVGFPEGALLHQAGVRRAARGDAPPAWGEPGNGLWGGTYPYGADPRDQEMTRKGFAFYARRYG